MTANRPVAHTPRASSAQWHYLDDHLKAVAERAGEFAKTFGAEEIAYLSGLLHDIGKAGQPFQDYLKRAYANPHLNQKKVDHSSAGAVVARELYTTDFPDLAVSTSKGAEVAWVVAAHHAGLDTLFNLEKRLVQKSRDQTILESIPKAEEALPELTKILDSATPTIPDFPNSQARELFIRMLLSVLVDADHLDTEAFRSPDKFAKRERQFDSIASLMNKLEQSQQEIQGNARSTPVNQARKTIYETALEKALESPGFFRLTVPTGGGKTRTSLGFALKHAMQFDLQRVIYAIPYTSIIDQTASEFRNILGDENVLEHHSAFEPDDDETENWSKLASENWDAPVIVTTTVQLFESLFANKPSKVRKLHRLAKSVIVLDEVQTLPASLLDPILDMLRELVRFYGATVVLCTATQPALDESPQFAGLPNVREIAPEPEKYFRELARVTYTSHVATRWAWEKVAEELKQHEQVLCIVNTKKHARELFALLDDKEALHLSTNMCMAHRRKVLEQIRQNLKNKQPCRVISTQLVEAGVDLDFPVVYRALGPLDSIVQAAGRCNREGLLDEKGHVIIFKPEDMGLPKGVYGTATLLATRFLKSNLHEPDVFKRYFASLYQDLTDTDAHKIQELRSRFNFPEVAKLFKLIDDNTYPVVVPYSDEATRILKGLSSKGFLDRETLRALQPFMVNVYQNRIDELDGKALIRPAFDPDIKLWEWVGVYDKRLGIVEEVGAENFIV